MRYTIFNKFLFFLFFLLFVSVQLSAQGSFSAGSAVKNNSPSDTIIIQNSDGTVEKKVIKKNSSVSRSPARENAIKQKPDGNYTEIIIKKAEPVMTSQADTILVQLSDNTFEQRIIKRVIQADTIEIELPDGSFEQRIFYRNISYDCDDSKVYENVDVKPQFIGGQEALKKYISDNLKYPEYETRNKIEGQIIVQFTINKFGMVTDVQAVNNAGNFENLAREAVRIVSKMPDWKPGQKDNLRVNTRYSLPIEFKLKK